MTTGLTCSEVEDQALVERYAAGTLAPDQAEAFEAHYLTCERCQNGLRLAAAVRDTMSEVGVGQPSRRRLMASVGIGLGAAAVLALILLPVTGGRPDEKLVQLGAVLQPPIYLGVAVRASEAAGDSLFEAAMTAYLSEDYGEAARGLAGALDAGVDSAPAEFFLASSLLMEDRSPESADAFRRVIALGESPYLGEAHFYLAKALLRLGRGQEAQERLRSAADMLDELRGSAVALADSIQGVLQR